MNESSIMLLAGPGSAYGGNEFRGKLDDKCPTMELIFENWPTKVKLPISSYFVRRNPLVPLLKCQY